MSTRLEQYGDLLDTFFAEIGDRVKEAAAQAVREERRVFAGDEPALAARLAEINAKVNLTVPEGALLLGCSDSHLYKLIKRAEEGRTTRPIPYLDLDGVKVLPRGALLEWAKPPAPRALAGVARG